MYKNINKSKKSTEHSSPLYQTYTPIVIYKHETESGSSNRRWVVLPLPQTAQGNSVAKPGKLLLIMLSLVSKSYIKLVHINLSNPFFKKKVHGQKHHKKADKCWNSITYTNFFILRKYCLHQVQDNRCSERACSHRLSITNYTQPHNSCQSLN